MVTLIEKYLTEDIEAVRRQYSYIPEEDFDRIIRLDPTFDENRNSVGKYGKWLLGLYKKHPEEYVSMTKNILKQYDELKNDRRYNIEKDIMKIDSVRDLIKAIDNVQQVPLSKKQSQRQAKKDKNYDLVFETKDYWVFVPKNHEGDMVLASYGGSKKALWCTAADSEEGIHWYNHYLNEGGYYYVLINKNDYEDKYQFHFESDQFMDAGDRGIDYDEFCEEQEGLAQFFSNDWANRRAYSKERDNQRMIKLFNLPPDIDIEKEKKKTITLDAETGDVVEGILGATERHFNSEFVDAIRAYVENGENYGFDVEYYRDAVEDFKGVSVKRELMESELRELGMSNAMIDDFCDDVGGFVSDLENGVYDDEEIGDDNSLDELDDLDDLSDEDEDYRDRDTVDVDYILNSLRDALEEAGRLASESAYEQNIQESVDDALRDIKVVRDTTDWSYKIVATRDYIYGTLCSDSDRDAVDESKTMESVAYYYLDIVFENDFSIEEPYYGWDDTPDDDLLTDCLYVIEIG